MFSVFTRQTASVTLVDTATIRSTVETRSTDKKGQHDTPDNMVSRCLDQLEEAVADFGSQMTSKTDDELAAIIDSLASGQRVTVGRFELSANL